jgi:tRNA(Ile)-lysidine synthase
VATTRSHPPTLETLARRTITDLDLARRGERVLAAVSGGPDSMAMLHVLSRLSSRLGFTLVAHGVDHGLRPSAQSELDLAESLAVRLGVAFGRTRVALAPGGNLQARARDARCGALRAAASEAEARVIATAHHADDRAETVLLRLLQGSGLRGLACLPARSGDLIRPLIQARRADVLAHLERHRIAYATDPSNGDPRFLRARVRSELVPVLERLSPSITAHLNGLADDLARLPDELLPTGLRRPQREQAARAGKRGTKLRLAGQGDVRVTLSAGHFVISQEGTD